MGQGRPLLHPAGGGIGGRIQEAADSRAGPVLILDRLAPMDDGRIQVECYSGHRVNERPIAFTYQGRRREIQEIIDRWYEGGMDPKRPEISYFKVKTHEGQ